MSILNLVEHLVLTRLVRGGVKLGASTRRPTRGYALAENLVLRLGLLSARSLRCAAATNVWAVAEGIEAMGREGRLLC